MSMYPETENSIDEDLFCYAMRAGNALRVQEDNVLTNTEAGSDSE